MAIADLVHINVDLLSVGVAVTGIALLGFLIYFNNSSSITNRTFFAFALITVVWGISNYLEYRFPTAQSTLWALRIHLFISTWHAYFFFRLAYVFPRESATFPFWYRAALTPIVFATSVLTLTPLVFSRVVELAPPGMVTNPERGFGIALFSLVAFGLLFAGIGTLIAKWRRAKGSERGQLLLFLTGMASTAILILLFNVFLPVVLNQLGFIPLAALFLLPIVALTSYAIRRYHLFNLKVATTAFLGFMVTVFTFVNIIYAETLGSILLNLTAFIIVLIGSIRIVRDTLDLVEQRETILKQEQELELVNREQESLLRFLSHEVKGYLTESQAGFASIVEGDYGSVPEAIKTMAGKALASVRRGVTTVMEILDASNFKKGTVSYEKKKFDFRAAIREIVKDLEPDAAAKGLTIDLGVGEGVFDFLGDEDKLKRHVVRNLIDNAIKYTPTGAVKVALTDGATIRFSVKDSGIGITPEDMKRLFTEGGHGKDSLKTNVHSTGYGLYIAKKIIDAHGGKIWAESEGQGKGSTFIVEFPLLR